MSKLIKQNTSLFFAILLFFAIISTFAISNVTAKSMPTEDCRHCGSVESCLNGGQDYGYNGCLLRPGELGTPQGCEGTHGRCGTDADPQVA